MNINALRQTTFEIRETFQVLHDRPKGVGNVVVFYADKHPVLKMELTMQTLPGQSYDIEATHK